MSESMQKFVSVYHPERVDNSSMDNQTDSELPSVVVTQVAAGITTVFMLFGLVGNLLVIAAVARKKSLRTRGNAFIVSLSVVGLLYVAFVLVPGIDTLIYREWRTGDFMCGFHTYYTLAFSLLSLLHTMCIGLDRLVNVVMFTRAKKIASRRNIAIAVVLCWLVTIGVMMCYHFFVVAGKMYYLEKALRCIAIYNATSWKVSLSVYCFIYVLPSIVIVVSYVIILSFVRKKRRILNGRLGAKTAPSRTALTSVTTGEPPPRARAASISQRDRVTFAKGTLEEARGQEAQPLRSPPMIPCPAENSPNASEVERRGSGSVAVQKTLDGTKNASFIHQNQSSLLADIHERIGVGDANYQPYATAESFPDQKQGCDEPRERQVNVLCNGTTATVSTSTNLDGETDSKSRHQDRDLTRKRSRKQLMNADASEKTVPLVTRSLSFRSSARKIESTPSQHDLNRRRGSVWPAVPCRKRLSEVAKTLDRSRDRLNRPSRIRNDRDLNRMMLAVFLVVWIGYIPFPLVRYIDIPTLGIIVNSNVYMAVTLTSYIAGCVNPIIYGFMHRRFRAAFVEMLTLGKCKPSNRVGAKGCNGSVSGTEGSTAVQPRDGRRDEA